MAPRNNPSERQRRLGAELRKLRVRAGLTGEQAAAFLDADRARVSNIETGRIDVSRNRLYKVLQDYGCRRHLLRRLMAMAQENGKAGGVSSARRSARRPVTWPSSNPVRRFCAPTTRW